ncbi:CLUMA_CG005042, isoform A [Clunio marinus]|uniref:CLUMA_CG005042, isoform A n=1 Tax=Clunio marinus TaxID=568069 RepID=A0A1J1HZ24_9DIPT|nr:CLUMA_CG005042, isoform A [Clunio marinus]
MKTENKKPLRLMVFRLNHIHPVPIHDEMKNSIKEKEMKWETQKGNHVLSFSSKTIYIFSVRSQPSKCSGIQ